MSDGREKNTLPPAVKKKLKVFIFSSTMNNFLSVGCFNSDLRMMRRKNSMESGPNSADEMEMTGGEKSQRMRRGTERYKKAIRLSSEQLVSLSAEPFLANYFDSTPRYYEIFSCDNSTTLLMPVLHPTSLSYTPVTCTCILPLLKMWVKVNKREKGWERKKWENDKDKCVRNRQNT